MMIESREIDADHAPYVIAEIGVNHAGSTQRAEKLIAAAAQAGADAVKFQFFQASQLLSRAAVPAAYQTRAGEDDPSAMLRRLQLSIDQLRDLRRFARECNVQFLVSVFSVELVDAAESLECDAYKIASPDVINQPLIERLMQTNRPLVVSTGAAAREEVASAVQWLGAHPYALLQCVSAYPTPDACAALGGIAALRELTDRPVGYSDHTTALDTGALAVAAGACVLEKHLTDDRSAPGPDHAASITPAQLEKYVHLAHRAWHMRGKNEKVVLDIEHDVQNVSRQSITAARNLHAGHRLECDDLTIKRPGLGISPARLRELIGRTVNADIDADTPITDAHLG